MGKQRNPFHKNVIKKYGRKNILVGTMECSDEATAFELEKGLIKRFRAMGYKLTNMTNGGEGMSGYVYTDEHREKQRKASTGRKQSKESIEKTRQAKIGKKLSPKHIEKLKLAQRKPVCQYTLDGEYVATYRSAIDIAEQFNYKADTIRQICNNRRKQAYGFVWKYKENL